tara:strand:- start:5496 stop:6011 length:516 start_codon:yes stop_codon:yes gene_type:complete
MKSVSRKLKKLSALLEERDLPSESTAVSWLLKEEPEEAGLNERLPDQSLSASFSLYEFNCKDKNKTPVPKKYLNNIKELAKNLEIIRAKFNKPIQIISGYRTPEYNKSIGGATKSQHMLGKAADIRINGVTSKEIKEVILKLINEGKISQGGVGSYPSFVHYDVRGVKARW